ncbi:MAG: HDOD domain-containing protein [Inquilinus sp.]|nr:HDOD domain-containing protein [Inquilinus sp.]
MKPVVLFVDDEPHLLHGLRRNLRSMRDRWDMHFAEGGREALVRTDQGRIDVIISDMRMPGMDGAELLSAIADRQPRTIRFVLSGQTEESDAFRLIGISHQFHSKPCETETLIAAIDRTLQFRDAVSDETLQTRVSSLQRLPCSQANFDALIAETGVSDPSAERLAAIVASDMALAARFLQIAGSGYFGVGDFEPTFTQAIGMLGVERIARIASNEDMFLRLPSSESGGGRLDRLVQHGVVCSQAARAVAVAAESDPESIEAATVAGLLHDIGYLALSDGSDRASDGSDIGGYGQERRSLGSERSEYGSDHAAVGAYLAALWGLSEAVVKAIAHHHAPSAYAGRPFAALTAVHAAECIIEARFRPAENRSAVDRMDRDYLAAAGVQDRVAGWVSQLSTSRFAEQAP